MPLISPTTRAYNKLADIGKLTVPVSRNLALRIYSDTRPHNGKIADLQKGLIVVYKGEETIGEGTGFGVPVVMCLGETYFSGSSHVHMSKQADSTVIRKAFFMDRIARNTFRNVRVRNRSARAALKHLAELYQKNERLRFLVLKQLSLRMGYGTDFVRVLPIGAVTVTYYIGRGSTRVRGDFSALNNKHLRRVFMLNEQGSTFFRRYHDSDGTELLDKRIGAWNPVEPEWASLSSINSKVGFRLKRMPRSFLRRGREYLEGSLDWVGLDYEFNPENAVFEYEIEVEEGAQFF